MTTEDNNRQYTPDEVREMMAAAIEITDERERDSELICGAVLLAEASAKEENYTEVKQMAEYALELADGGNVEDDTAIAVLERMADAVEYTPYNHLLRELLSRLIMIVAEKEPDELPEYKHEAETLVKLMILMGPDPFERVDKELKEVLARLFSAEELMGFICYPAIGHLLADPVEYTWEFEEIAEDLQAELDEMLADVPRGMGFCFRYWDAKERLLKEKYGIRWRSPGRMNPGVMFD